MGAGILAVILAVLPGILLGLLAGYAGGWLDAFLMRIVDVLLAFPSLLLALTMVTVLGPGLLSVVLAVGLAGIPRFARVVRASASQVRLELFIEAARVVGCRPSRILLRHIAPNLRDIIMPLAALELGYALINISALMVSSDIGMKLTPQSLNRIELGAIGRQEMQDDPLHAFEHFLHSLGLVDDVVIQHHMNLPVTTIA